MVQIIFLSYVFYSKAFLQEFASHTGLLKVSINYLIKFLSLTKITLLVTTPLIKITLLVTAPLLSMSTRLKICLISSSVTCHHHLFLHGNLFLLGHYLFFHGHHFCDLPQPLSFPLPSSIRSLSIPPLYPGDYSLVIIYTGDFILVMIFLYAGNDVLVIRS